jgi:hypothetical protein
MRRSGGGRGGSTRWRRSGLSESRPVQAVRKVPGSSRPVQAVRTLPGSSRSAVGRRGVCRSEGGGWGTSLVSPWGRGVGWFVLRFGAAAGGGRS